MRKSVFYLFIALTACLPTSGNSQNNSEASPIPTGKYTRSHLDSLPGFSEERNSILSSLGITEEDFIRLSTDSAWSLPETERERLIAIRSNVSKPDSNTLLQKVIPLEEVALYANNTYGGTIGGFVCEAADVKCLCTLEDVFYGLRLDYEGTKFNTQGTGYAAIRFYSPHASDLIIPYSPELGGRQPHAWPNGGGGFTTSTIHNGGFPEWVMTGYTLPREGAELYEVSSTGQETLRLVYKEGKWQTPGTYSHTDMTSTSVAGNLQEKALQSTTYGDYAGHTYIILSETNGFYHLRTFTPVEGTEIIEKGIYGIDVPVNQVQNIRTIPDKAE